MRLSEGLLAAGCVRLRTLCTADRHGRMLGMPPISVIMRRLRQSFVARWSHRGVSPIGRLTTASEQWMEGERTAIEQESASLSVKLLLPTGLCMLPAFVFLGILPSVMAFVG